MRRSMFRPMPLLCIPVLLAAWSCSKPDKATPINERAVQAPAGNDAAAGSEPSSEELRIASSTGGLQYWHKIEDLENGYRIVSFDYLANQPVTQVMLNYKQINKDWTSKSAKCSPRKGNASFISCYEEIFLNNDGDYVQYNFSFVIGSTKFETKDYYDTQAKNWTRKGEGSFTDDFDTSMVDTDRWYSHFDGAPPNNEVHCYRPIDNRHNVVMHNAQKDGWEGRKKQEQFLVLRAEPVDAGNPLPSECLKNDQGVPYETLLKDRDPKWFPPKFTSGKIISKTTYKHGRFEIRARVPDAFGSFPAIWFLPIKDGAWPATGELDIMETQGEGGKNRAFTSTIIYHKNYDSHLEAKLAKGEGAHHRRHSFNVPYGKRISDDFHVYAMEWTSHDVAYFFDGQEVVRFHRYSGDNRVGMDQTYTTHRDLWHWDKNPDGSPYVGPKCENGTACWPYDNHRMNLVINLALVNTDIWENGAKKGTFAPDGNQLSQPNIGQMQIDYVHIFRPR